MPTSLDDYEVVDVIGTGSYGVCKKIRRKKDGRILVWKELNYGSMSEMEKQMLVSEVNLLRELKHKHIVRYYDRIIDRPNTTLYIVMEYCEGGDLNTLLNNKKKDQQNFDEFFIWKICSQIILALKECHSRERNGKAVLHRDLKPANVFLDRNNNVKLGDFGLARVLNHDTSFAKTFVGTPYYMSPEQINYMSYNAKSDIWSLGCLLYELCAHRPPFTAMNQRELASKISVGRFMRIPNRYSDELNSFIGTLIQVDEHKRPTIERLLEHPTVRLYAPGATSATSSPGSDTAPPPPRRRPSMEAAGSGDEGYSSRKLESIKRREDELLELEKRLKQKEADLEVREKNVSLREKLAEDRLLRADRLVREYKTVKSTCSCGASIRVKTSDSSPHGVSGPLSMSSTPDLQSSCLIKQRRDNSPKKKVSFHDDKENRKLKNDLRLHHDNMRQMQELEKRLDRRNNSSASNMDYVNKYNNRYVLGLW